MHDESRLSAAPADPSRSTQESTEWPNNLPTDALTKLVRQLNAAVTSGVNDLARPAEFDDLICAAAVARQVLRRRLARQRLRDAREALRESGWKP